MTLDLELEPPSRARRTLRKAKVAEAGVAAPPGLTAGDLIAMLEDLDPATPVVLKGQYGGYDSARGISRIPLRFNVNQMDGFGPHDRASPGEPPQARAVAVLVTPKSSVAD